MNITSTSRSIDSLALRRLRKSAGLTQRQLAGAAGCSLSWIANAEGGYIPRTSDTLARVLEVLRDSTR